MTLISCYIIHLDFFHILAKIPILTKSCCYITILKIHFNALEYGNKLEYILISINYLKNYI